MKIFLECTNKTCEYKKIPVELKGALKANKCPSCEAPLGLTGEEAQVILLIKAMERLKWSSKGISGEDITQLIHEYYIKDLELKLPKILVEETQEERATRKLLNELKTDKIREVVQDTPVVPEKKPELTIEQSKKAQENADMLERDMKAAAIRTEEIHNEDNGGFTFSGGVSEKKLHIDDIITAGQNIVPRKLIKNAPDAGPPPSKPIPTGPPAPFANRHLIFTDDSNG